MTTLTIAVDTSQATAAAEELRELFGTGAAVSQYVKDRIVRMLDENRSIELEPCESGLVAVPSSEMLAILATLRAHGLRWS